MKPIYQHLASIVAVVPIAPLLAPLAAAADSKAGLAIAGGIFAIIIVLFAFVALLSIFWIWMIIDCATRENFRNDSDKVIWILVLVFLGFLGAIIYYFAVRRSLGHPTGSRKRRKK